MLVDSAYILPSNYLHLKDAALEKQRNLNELESSILNSFFELDNKVNDKRINKIIDDNEKKLSGLEAKINEGTEKKIKENQVSYIQIIGLYASIITFVLGSISIIPKFEYAYTNILIFMLMFASCLCLFVFLLKTLFDSSNKNRYELSSQDYFAFLLFLVVFLGSICIISVNRKNDKNFKMTITKGKSLNDSTYIDTTEVTIIKSNYIPPKEEKDKIK